MSRHIHLIRGSYDAGFVAIYVILGRRVTLVDTGYAHHPVSSIAPGLAALGLALRDVDLVLTTHGHVDHAGGLAAVVEASDANVAIHPADRARLPSRWTPPIGGDEFAAAFRRLGLEHRATEREAMLLESSGSSVEVRHLLAGGDRIDLGSDIEVEVVETPGHTAGSVAFVVRPDGIALVGDAIQGLGGGSGLPLYVDPDAYRASLARVAEMDVSAVAMGHAFRSENRVAGWPVAPAAALGPLVTESATFPMVAAEVASTVAKLGLPSTTDAVREFLALLPPPFETLDTDPLSAGSASLHAALVHLDRVTTEAQAPPA